MDSRPPEGPQEPTGGVLRPRNGFEDAQDLPIHLGGKVTSDYQGWTNWDTWHTKLLMDNEQRLFDQSRKIVQDGINMGWSDQAIAERLRDWAVMYIIGPHNRQAIIDAQEWNDIPKEERVDQQWEETNEQTNGLLNKFIGPDIEDTDPMTMDTEIVNWYEIVTSIKEDLEEERRYNEGLEPTWQEPQAQPDLDKPGDLTIPSDWGTFSKVAEIDWGMPEREDPGIYQKRRPWFIDETGNVQIGDPGSHHPWTTPGWVGEIWEDTSPAQVRVLSGPNWTNMDERKWALAQAERAYFQMQDKPDQRTAMAERSGDALLDALIEEFMRDEDVYLTGGGDVTRADYRNPSDAAGHCDEVAEFFAGWLSSHGVKATLSGDQTLHEPLPDGEGLQEWTTPDELGYGDRPTRGYPDHYATIAYMPTGTYMIDWTASQFGYSEFPMVQRLDGEEWQRKWAATPQNIIYHNDEDLPQDSQFEQRTPYLYDWENDILHWGLPGWWHNGLDRAAHRWYQNAPVQRPIGELVPGAVADTPHGLAHAIYQRYLPDPMVAEPNQVRQRLEELVGAPLLPNHDPDSIMTDLTQRPDMAQLDTGSEPDWGKIGAEDWRAKYEYHITDGNERKTCSNCSAFKAGKCAMFNDDPVEPDAVCTEWSKTWKKEADAGLDMSSDNWWGPQSVNKHEVTVPGAAPGMGDPAKLPGSENTLQACTCGLGYDKECPFHGEISQLHQTLNRGRGNQAINNSADHVYNDGRFSSELTPSGFTVTDDGDTVMLHDGKQFVGWIAGSTLESSKVFDDRSRAGIDFTDNPREDIAGPFFHPDTGGPVYYLSEIYVDEDYSKTDAYQILVGFLQRKQVPVYCEFTNDRLARLWHQRYQAHVAALTVDGDNWVWLDGRLGFGKEHADIAMRLAQQLGYDKMQTAYVSNSVARNFLPEDKAIAVGTMRGGYPQIWMSTRDRNHIWDEVMRARDTTSDDADPYDSSYGARTPGQFAPGQLNGNA